MRRAALAAIGILGVAGIASADPWTVRMEPGAEAAPTVARTEATPVAAAAGRLGARIKYRDELLGGVYLVDVSGLARMVARDSKQDESVMLNVGELRWLHPIGASAAAAGVQLDVADSFGVLSSVGARTYRSLGGDGVVPPGHGEDYHLVLGVGARAFTYKPDDHFNWNGPVASARLDAWLWH